MEPNWEHIKREILSKETPLSDGAWNQMDGLLEAQKAAHKKGFGWWLAIPVLLILTAGIYWAVQKTEAPAELPTDIKNDLKRAHDNAGLQNENALDEKEATIRDKKTETKPEIRKEKNPQKTAPILTALKKEIRPEAPVASQTSTEESATKSNLNAMETSTSTAEKIGQAEDLKTDTSDVFTEETILVTANNTADSTSAEGQKQKLQQVNNKGVWELKAFAGPSYNMPNISYTSVENYTHRDYENATNNSVKQGWGFDAGLEISYFFTPNFKLSTGVNYREIVTTNNMNYEVSDVPVIDSASGQILGYITLPNATTYSSSAQNSFVYVGVPVSLFKEIPLRGRFSLTGEFVNTFSFLLNENSLEINPTTLQTLETESSNFNPVLVNYQLRLGVRYRVNQNLLFALEPAYRGSYNNIYKSDYITWKPRDFTLNAAIIIQLRKK